VDGPRARRALARVLNEEKGFPRALKRRLRQCQDGARWTVPLSVDELTGQAVRVASATVVLSRHSGEVLWAEGDILRAMPYGSTLKPFVVAGSPKPPPVLAPRGEVAEWKCGEGLPRRVEARTALLRSCNGYFLDWEGKGSAPEGLFGAWGEVLSAVGLSGRPLDMADAIGLRASLRLSPWGLAQAYRLLAEAKPDVLAVLAGNAVRGTLSGLPASKALEGVATKTGTVRDEASRPRLGWIVAVDEDVVAVVARAERMPRDFAGEVSKVLEKVRRKRARVEVAREQVLGQVPSGEVEARCRGAGFTVEGGVPRVVPEGFSKLRPLVEQGPAVCLGAPWRVRISGSPSAVGEYAGIFMGEAPPYAFRTTRLQYSEGVVKQERLLERAAGVP